jgi:hypothetical protein
LKKRNVLKSGVLSLAVLAWATFAPSASAAIVGHLSVANCPNGGVTVTAGGIDWLPEVGGPPESSCVQLGALTNLTSFSMGTLTGASPAGTINDLPPAGGISGFMTFSGFKFDLAAVNGFGPGSPTSCASNPGLNFSCSIPGSVFLLTQTGTGSSVTLLAHGTIFDPGDGITSFWNGAFTTQIGNQLPATIQSTILAGGSITSSYSGEFNVTVPEPASMAFIGGGLIALACIKRRKRA